jgi:thiamine kinase
MTGNPPKQTVLAFDPVRLVTERSNCVASAITCEPLTGGYLNQVFRLTGPFGDWVVKCFKESDEITLFPNIARAEARALSLLGPLEIAPRLIDFVDDPDHGLMLIYSFHPGEVWPGSMREADASSLSSVATLLRRQHQLTADGFREVPVTPADILAQGDQFLIDLDRRQELRRLRPAVIDCPVLLTRSLLHTDVGPGNLITGPQGLRLIDWQCPALGDPAEDLCAFLSPAFQILYGCRPLTLAQRETFLTAYGDRRVIERLQILEPFFHWRMAAYCQMRRLQYATTRPAAAAAYDLALDTLLKELAKVM